MVKDLEMLPIEMVVRDYMTGSTETSIWPMYERGERTLYGHVFPEGLVRNQKLPDTIITPTTKAAQGDHDAPITESEILKTQLVTTKQWHELAEKSLALFKRGRELAAKNGLILVDTKYEFGLDENGTIVVADEIHTPDSSRFWIANSYEEYISKAIKFSSEVTKQFNFEGSMIKPIERFFRAFGAKQIPYFEISKSNSNLINWYKNNIGYYKKRVRNIV